MISCTFSHFSLYFNFFTWKQGLIMTTGCFQQSLFHLLSRQSKQAVALQRSIQRVQPSKKIAAKSKVDWQVCSCKEWLLKGSFHHLSSLLDLDQLLFQLNWNGGVCDSNSTFKSKISLAFSWSQLTFNSQVWGALSRNIFNVRLFTPRSWPEQRTVIP